MMILFIDTTSLETKIALLNESGDFIDKSEWTSQYNQSEELILKIEELLKKNKAKKGNLEGIVVVAGPGSFTGVRIGVTTANFMALGLNIPVIGVKKDQIDQITNIVKKHSSLGFNKPVMPIYDKKPNITKPKNT